MFKSTNGGGNWSAVNTGLTGTTVHALAIDPATPATLYAGTDGGVFKSTNGGGNWSAVNTGLTNTMVYALAIDPATPTTLYAGTWQRRVQEHERRRELERGQHRPDRLPMFTPWRLIRRRRPPSMRGHDGGGVFKSTNGGGNWSAVNTGLTNTYVHALAIDPATPATLYAGTMAAACSRARTAAGAGARSTPA